MKRQRGGREKRCRGEKEEGEETRTKYCPPGNRWGSMRFIGDHHAEKRKVNTFETTARWWGLYPRSALQKYTTFVWGHCCSAKLLCSSPVSDFAPSFQWSHVEKAMVPWFRHVPPEPPCWWLRTSCSGSPHSSEPSHPTATNPFRPARMDGNKQWDSNEWSFRLNISHLIYPT